MDQVLRNIQTMSSSSLFKDKADGNPEVMYFFNGSIIRSGACWPQHALTAAARICQFLAEDIRLSRRKNTKYGH